MFLTVHVAAGMTAAAALTEHPISAFAVGFASHFLIDMIPHGDELLSDTKKTHREKIIFLLKIAALDSFITLLFFLSLFFFFTGANYWFLGAAAFGAILPDVLQGLRTIADIHFLERFKRIHHFFHFLLPYTVSFRVGMMIQICVFFVIFAVLRHILVV